MRHRATWLAIAGVSVVGAVALTASPAAATISAPPPSVVNTATAQAVTVDSSNPSTVYAVAPTVELKGPGALTDTYDGTGTVVTPVGAICTPGISIPPLPPPPPVCVGGTSSISSTFNLDPANLPAAPGTYSLNVCTATCLAGSLTGDTTTLLVTGAPPAPTGTDPTPLNIAPGGSAAVKIHGTGFAKHDTVTASVAGVTVTVDNPQGTATELDVHVAVGAGVAPGTYNLTVKDTANQTGTCTGCLVVGSGGPGTTRPTKLSLGASKKTVVAGKSVTLSGVLSQAGEGLAGRTVLLVDKPDGGKLALLKTLHTDSTGRYTATVTPKASTTYRTAYAGKSAVAPQIGEAPSLSSKYPHVAVAPVVIAKARKSTQHTKPLVVTGRVKPSEAGQLVYLVASHGAHHVRLGATKLSSASHYRFDIRKKLTQPGKYKLVASIRARTGHAAASSKPVKIKRT